MRFCPGVQVPIIQIYRYLILAGMSWVGVYLLITWQAKPQLPHPPPHLNTYLQQFVTRRLGVVAWCSGSVKLINKSIKRSQSHCTWGKHQLVSMYSSLLVDRYAILQSSHSLRHIASSRNASPHPWMVLCLQGSSWSKPIYRSFNFYFQSVRADCVNTLFCWHPPDKLS